jgi:adenylate kinase
MQLVLVGPPGAGKGTQAHRLQERFGLGLIATGDIFRANLQQGTPLGLEAKSFMDAGELVPDDVVVKMVIDALAEAPDGFVLDGFPRNVPQAEALDTELEAEGRPLTAVLRLIVPQEVAVARVAGRRTCARCQRTYNVALQPTRVEGSCDVCGGQLLQREDDREETVRRRLEVYREQTEPIVGYYRDRGLLREIGATGSEDEVTARILAAIADRVPS